MGFWFESPLSAKENLEQADKYFEAGYANLKDREYYYDDLNMAINCYDNLCKALDCYNKAWDLYFGSDDFYTCSRCTKNISACEHNIKIAKTNVAECYMDEAIRLWNNYDYDEARRMREKALEWDRDMSGLEENDAWEF